MLADMLLRPFEVFLNRGLAQSTTAQALAADLEGRTLGLKLDGTPLDLRIRVSGGRIVVTRADGAMPDACIAGSPLALVSLLRRDPQDAVRAGDVVLGGDTDIVTQFRELLRFATPDLEEELARLVGDPLAHELGNATRAFGAWSARAGETLLRSTSEYLREESGVLPTGAEVREFAHRVDELVNDVARAEARIRQLKERK